MRQASEFVIYSHLDRDIGKTREENQDWVEYFEPDSPDELLSSGRLYIVADGVGGETEGRKASEYAAQKVLHLYFEDASPDPGERLSRAMRQAGNEIYDYSHSGGRQKRMGTTLVAAVIRGGTLIVANVGDSRAYLIRGGEARQITRDHSLIGERVRSGELSEEEAMNAQGKNRITRSLGGEYDVTVDIFPDIALQAGDRVLLCTDGLARYALSADIAHLASDGSPAEIYRRCIDFAYEHGAEDNIGVAVIEVAPLTASDDETLPARASRRPVAVRSLSEPAQRRPSETPTMKERTPELRAALEEARATLAQESAPPTFQSFTEPTREAHSPQPVSGSVRKRGSLVLALAILGVSLLVLVAVVATIVFLNARRATDAEPTVPSEATPIPATAEPATLPAQVAATPIPTQEPTAAITAEPTTAPTQAPPSGPSLASWNAERGVCQYEVQPGDSLFLIRDKFAESNPLAGFESFTEAEIRAQIRYADGSTAASRDLYADDGVVDILFIKQAAQCYVAR